VTKLNSAGTALVYSTYLGGSGTDQGIDIAVDAAGSAYVTGTTDSTNFPTTAGAFQAALAGTSTDAFVTKLSPAGAALVYSTYLGGSGSDQGVGIAVDAGGSAYVTGLTGSANFPTASPIQAALVGSSDAFVTKLNPTGSAPLVYSTYLGGSGAEQGNRIAVDAAGSAYVTGTTDSLNFPTTAGAFQTASGGLDDAFVTKLTPAGSALAYSTYLGGSGTEQSFGIAVDSAGSAYVTGTTDSPNFPTTAGAFDVTANGGFDAFVTKLTPAGSALVYSTYLGGSGSGGDSGIGIAVDSAGNAYVTGETTSDDFPTASPVQAARGGGLDAFVTKLNPAGSALVYSTFLGGSNLDTGQGIAVDSGGNAYVAGFTSSPNFPTTTGAFDQTANGGDDTFVAKLTELATEKGRSGDECFIATAAFGSPLAAEVETLRIFRDRYLLPHGPGRLLVAAYARVSPPLAARIRQQEALRAAARLALRPVLWWAHLALVSPVLALALGGGTLMAGPLLLIHRRQARRISARGRNP
jgi:hypothetical protein